MGITVRVAGPADLDELVELSAGLFTEDAGQRDPYTDQGWPRREGRGYFAGIIDNSRARCWVAEVDRVIAGNLVGRINRESSVRPVRVAELESMFVRAEYRSSGVGAALVAEFFGWGKRSGAERALVTAYAENDRALAFYARHGFQPKNVSLERGL
jgi:GNAT superfamily N-acetyltransferase